VDGRRAGAAHADFGGLAGPPGPIPFVAQEAADIASAANHLVFARRIAWYFSGYHGPVGSATRNRTC
jgi:hypothetical protein